MRNRAVLCALLASSVLAAPLAGAEPAASKSRESAARELFDVTGGMKAASSGEEAMITAVRTNPQLGPYEDVFRTWYQKTMAKAGLDVEIVALYAEMFTEEELKGLTAFYRSPLGQKALSKVPEIMKRGAEIGVEAAKQNQSELEKMLEARRVELEAKEKSQAPSAPPVSTPSPTPAPKKSSPATRPG